MHCQADGFPKPKISWHKPQSSVPAMRSSVTENNSLVLINVHSYDSGAYECRAESLFGSAAAFASLVVRVPVRFDYVPPRKVYVTPGQSIRLRCSATGYPQPTITWSRGAEGLPKGAYFSNGTLTIKDISDVELGQYSCVVRNILGQKSYSLALAYRGKVTSIGYGVEVREFSDLILNCKLCFKLGAKFNFTWSKIEGELPLERAYQTGCALVVSNATMNDTGKYLCSGRSVDRVSDESIRAILEVTVIGAPKITTLFKDVTLVHPGGDLELKCSAVGPPHPVVTWTKGSQKVLTNDSETAVLLIKKAGKDDEGEYRCYATNYLGEDVVETVVYLIGLMSTNN
ncbi:peroxidasin-like [Corticium candelabrum]|uniref:peroxidasin-like n=1 Tax=Corticium candelabrum TaxID=121492 RepID=UPI002E26FF34|nr:peroxidasin-like [Corticium candelabrum]